MVLAKNSSSGFTTEQNSDCLQQARLYHGIHVWDIISYWTGTADGPTAAPPASVQRRLRILQEVTVPGEVVNKDWVEEGETKGGMRGMMRRWSVE